MYDFALAHEHLAKVDMEQFYSCCGKTICGGCIHSFRKSGIVNCPYCNKEIISTTDEERVEELMKRVDVNDACSIYLLSNHYREGQLGLLQDQEKAMELYARAADLGYSKAHYDLGVVYHEEGNMKKAKFHFEAAAMLGDDGARCNLGQMEGKSGDLERAGKH